MLRSAVVVLVCIVSFAAAPAKAAAVDDWLALTKAAEGGDLKTVQQLLGRGVNPDTPHPGLERLSPLVFASTKGHLAIVRALVEHHADVNAYGSSLGFAPLMYAAAQCHPDIVAYLLQHGAQI